jgi:hypothetical protein
MRINQGALFAALVVLGTFVFGLAAQAQLERRQVTVQTRPRPETDAVGVRSGGFMILPTITVSEAYNDNIFAVENGERDDLITDIKPAIIAKSDWNRHALEAFASADLGFFSSNSDENFQDYEIGARARLDVLRDTFLTGGIVYSALHESRASPDDSGGVEPGEFSIVTPEIGFYSRFNRFALSGSATLRRFDFDDVRVGGATVNEDDRDRDRVDLVMRGGYEIVPGYQAFLRVNLNSTEYDDKIDDNGFRRDSDGYEVVIGARLDLSGVTFGDVFVGYVAHEFDDARLGTIDGITLGADLTWNMTELTTVKIALSRTVSETTLSNTSGTFDTNFDVSADHELLRQLIISARAGLGLQEFEGSSRDDSHARFGFGAKYLVNRRLDLLLDYDYTRRDSDAAGSDFTENLIMLRAVGKL